MMRYDPTKKDHAECEIPVKKQALKKPDRAKKVPGENGDIEKERLPELSKDTFFNVSDKLVDTLKQDGQFSLLKAFGAAEPSIGTKSEALSKDCLKNRSLNVITLLSFFIYRKH